MRINDTGTGPVRGTRPAEAPYTGGGRVRPAASAERADRVQISAAGRELAARGGEGPDLTPERIAEVRRRILEGAYGSAEVVGRVAGSVLLSGHL